MSNLRKDVIKEDYNNEIKSRPKLLSRDNIKSYLCVLAVIFGIIAIFYLIAFIFGIPIAPNLGVNQGGTPQGGGGSPQGGTHPPPKAITQGGAF